MRTKKHTINLLVILSIGFIFSFSSCANKNYPCPGLGQTDPADLSMFDENGTMKGKDKKGRIDKSTGIVNKKNPKKIRRKRKTKL